MPVCRSCVQRGYFGDSFVKLFVKPCDTLRVRSLPPVINRGYYARHMMIKSLMLRFLEEYRDKSAQIVVLGCGFDTLYFQLKAAGLLGSHLKVYVECDFPDVIEQKQHILDATTTMNHTDGVYRMLGVDLRRGGLVMEDLARVGIQRHVPTLFLAECVLVYMETVYSNALLSSLGSTFEESMVIVYEQVNPGDAFGKQMMLNLRLRGCPLKGIIESLDAQKQRMLACGWQQASSEDMLTLFNTCISTKEIARINAIEMLDEEEEWNLLLRHYCITWARNSAAGLCLPSMSDIHQHHLLSL